MKIRLVDAIVPGLAAILGIALIVLWRGAGSQDDFLARVPGLDRPASGSILSPDVVHVPEAGEPILGEGIPSTAPGRWPGFRGPKRDAICLDGPALSRSWPADGPPVLWSVELGEGYAGAAVRDGCVYVLDYDEQAQADTMRCLSLDDGREIWRNGYPILVTRNHGMSRTVPVIAENFVISLGPRCHVACWDAETGKNNWLIDLVSEFGTAVPRWYAGQCPLVDEGRLIIAPCGRAMLIAIDYQTGEILWESPNPRGWSMTHVSVVPMDFQERRTYVYCGSGGVAGISADDGSLLWDSTEWPEQFASSPSPVALPDGKIFLCSGYDNKTGSLMLQLKQLQADSSEESRVVAEPAFRLHPKRFNSEQQTPIFYDGYLFGVRKRGGGQLVCLDLEGNEVWNSGKDRFGHGPYMIADGMILVMDDHGRLVAAEANAKAYRKLTECQALTDGHDAWGPMTLVAGRLIVRDMTRMVCLNIAEE